MIEILNPAELVRARDAGALVADILQEMKRRSAVGVNLLDLDRWTKKMIEDAGAQSCYVDYAPSFGRGPFGHYICTAVIGSRSRASTPVTSTSPFVIAPTTAHDAASM